MNSFAQYWHTFMIQKISFCWLFTKQKITSGQDVWQYTKRRYRRAEQFTVQYFIILTWSQTAVSSVLQWSGQVSRRGLVAARARHRPPSSAVRQRCWAACCSGPSCFCCCCCPFLFSARLALLLGARCARRAPSRLSLFEKTDETSFCAFGAPGFCRDDGRRLDGCCEEFARLIRMGVVLLLRQDGEGAEEEAEVEEAYLTPDTLAAFCCLFARAQEPTARPRPSGDP